MATKAKTANAYGKVLLNSYRNGHLGGADRAIIAYQLGLISRFEAKLAYMKYKEVEKKLADLAMGSFK